MLSIGIIGLGAVGLVHLSAYKNLTGGKLVAVAENNEATLAKVDIGDAKGFSDVSAMLDAMDLDIVVICTPASSHEALATICANHGVNILIEKPIALTPDSGTRIVDVCTKNNVKLYYGSTYRCLPAVVAARNIVQRGDIGEIELMVEQVIGGKGYDACSAMSFGHYPEGGPGGFPMGIIDHGIHLIDVFGWISGLNVVDAKGRGNISGQDMRAEFLTLTYENGALGNLLYHEGTYSAALPAEGAFSAGAGWDIDGYVSPGAWTRTPASICIYGRTGALRIMHYGNFLYKMDATGVSQIPIEGTPAPDHFRVQLETFIEDVELDRPATVPGEVGVSVLETALKAFDISQSAMILPLVSMFAAGWI